MMTSLISDPPYNKAAKPAHHPPAHGGGVPHHQPGPVHHPLRHREHHGDNTGTDTGHGADGDGARGRAVGHGDGDVHAGDELGDAA